MRNGEKSNFRRSIFALGECGLGDQNYKVLPKKVDGKVGFSKV